jgi:hypothetical protein
LILRRRKRMTIYNPYGGSQKLRLPNNPIEDIDWTGDVFADYLELREAMNQAKEALNASRKALSSHRQREHEARKRKEHLEDHGKTEEDYDEMVEADQEIRRLAFAGRDIAAREAARLKEYQDALERFQRYDYGMKSISVLRMGIANRIRNVEIERSEIEHQKMSKMLFYDNMLSVRQKRIDADNELLATIEDVTARLKEAGLFEDCTLGDREMNAEALKMVGGE